MNFQYRENVPLKDYTHYRIGGPARYFACPQSEEEVIKYVSEARSEKAPVYVMKEVLSILKFDIAKISKSIFDLTSKGVSRVDGQKVSFG
ncbi:MAG: hypothetical protein QW761_02860 [Candidatus Aenigmatarchaeota archaeon]